MEAITGKQVSFLKSLIKKNGESPSDYDLEDCPKNLASKTIQNFLDGIITSSDEFNRLVKEASAEDTDELVSLAAMAPPSASSEYSEPPVEPKLDRDVFAQEISRIHSTFLKELVLNAFTKVEDYFFIIPASSTGKYHPSYCLGNGGLVRHTKAAFKIAESMFDDAALHQFGETEKDLVRAAILLHDTCKDGYPKSSEYTVIDHPLLVEKLIDPKFKEVDSALVDQLVSAIRSHMGPWTKDKYGNEVLPYPETPLQLFVHTCDYLASRKFLEVKF